MTFVDWNNIPKVDEIDVEAVEGDIVEMVDGILFLLQTTNNYNNVVCKRVEPSTNNIIHSFYRYCLILNDIHQIEYIRVEGRKGRYSFLEKVFTREEIVREKDPHRDIFYANLSKCHKRLSLKCLEYEFYRDQKEYNQTKSKQAWDRMFHHIHFAVYTAMKARMRSLSRKGVIRDDLDDLVMDATVNIMERYTKPKGYEIKYLLTTADYAALGALHNPKQKFFDSQISLEAYNEYELGENKWEC